MLIVLGLLLISSLAGCQSDEPTTPTRTAPALSPVASRYVQQAQQALRSQAFVQGLAFADSAVTAAPFAPEGYFVQGRLYFALQQYDAAEEAYRKVAQYQADYPGLAHNQGNVLFQQRRHREALAFYTRATEQSDDPNPWHGLGGTHEALGNTDDAFAAYTQALAADPTYAPAHISLANWHEQSGAYTEALRHAEAAFAQDTTNLAYRYRAGALRHRTGASAEAIPLLRTVLDAEPWNYQAAFTLGQALQQIGDAGAIAMLEQANQLRAEQSDVDRFGRVARNEPDNFQAQITHADALRRSGRLTEALTAYHRAERLRPTNATLQTNLATLYAQSGQPDEAIARFRRLLRADSTNAEVWLNLALTYATAGRPADADAAVQQAFRYGADNPAVQAFRQRLQQRR